MEKRLLRCIASILINPLAATGLKIHLYKVKSFTNNLQLKHVIHISAHSFLLCVEDRNRFATQSSYQGVTQIHGSYFVSKLDLSPIGSFFLMYGVLAAAIFSPPSLSITAQYCLSLNVSAICEAIIGLRMQHKNIYIKISSVQLLLSYFDVFFF